MNMPSDTENAHEHESSLCLPLPRLAETSFASPTASLPMLTDESLHEACGTRICFTNRLGGVSPAPYKALNLSDALDDIPSAVRTNRRLLLETAGAACMVDSTIVPKQVHGDTVLVVDDVPATRRRALEGADGIACALLDVPVLLCFADCVPIILVAPGGAFCVVHAGWRGALAGIAGKALGLLCAQCGCKPSQCNAYIGPHIGSCCYEVSDDLLAEFVAEYGRPCDAGKGHLDLSAAVIVSLLSAGAVPERIIDAKVCTACNVDRYYSHRAEQGMTGRQGALAFREEKTWD